MKLLLTLIILIFMPINIELRAETIYKNGAPCSPDTAIEERLRSTPDGWWELLEDTTLIICGYDPDIYYIESIDTFTVSLLASVYYEAWLGEECDLPPGSVITSHQIDTTWAKYVTGKFTKEQWRALQEKMDRWLMPYGTWTSGLSTDSTGYNPFDIKVTRDDDDD